MPEKQTTEHKRIFLALWPNEETRQQLYDARKILKQDRQLRTVLKSARQVKPENLHMTLHFIGSVSLDVVQQLESCLSTISCQPFDMTVSEVGCFPRPKVIWLGLEQVPSELRELERLAADCVQQCVEDYRRSPFKAHITLFRKARVAEFGERLPKITWPVRSFALIESKTYAEGVQYQVLREWSLGQDL